MFSMFVPSALAFAFVPIPLPVKVMLAAMVFGG
jgi:hypothetical protein